MASPLVVDAGPSRLAWRGRRGQVVRAGLAVAAGMAWALAMPPRGWWVLFPLGVAALSIALHGSGPRARMLLGALCGLVFYVPGLGWLTDFNVAGYIALVLLETCLLAAVAAVVPSGRVGNKSDGWWALPAALVLLQAVQTWVPFGGFPLPALVHSQVDGPFAAAGPLGGSLLVTAAAATSGVALAALVVHRGRRRLLVAGTASILAAVPVLAGVAITTQPAGTIDTVIVQGGGPRGLRAISTDSMLSTERHLAAAEKIQGSPDLVVLPENVADVEGPIATSELDERFAELARGLDANLIVGVTEGYGDRFRNAAVLWGPNGDRADRYEKEHRVPFGEYIPARELFERLTNDTRFVPRDAIVGQGEAVLNSSETPLGVVISYEVFFANRVAEAVHAGGQIVLVPTNASSYVTDEVPALELATARLRAREFGRTVLQAAPTGYSAIVHPDGALAAVSDLGEEALLDETVPLRTGLTPYARVGDLPVIMLALGLIVVLYVRGTRKPGPSV
jgi:apolipoprotein N-acyltransferase